VDQVIAVGTIFGAGNGEDTRSGFVAASQHGGHRAPFGDSRFGGQGSDNPFQSRRLITPQARGHDVNCNGEMTEVEAAVGHFRLPPWLFALIAESLN
jgi:hypothetical protein